MSQGRHGDCALRLKASSPARFHRKAVAVLLSTTLYCKTSYRPPSSWAPFRHLVAPADPAVICVRVTSSSTTQLPSSILATHRRPCRPKTSTGGAIPTLDPQWARSNVLR